MTQSKRRAKFSIVDDSKSATLSTPSPTPISATAESLSDSEPMVGMNLPTRDKYKLKSIRPGDGRKYYDPSRFIAIRSAMTRLRDQGYDFESIVDAEGVLWVRRNS